MGRDYEYEAVDAAMTAEIVVRENLTVNDVLDELVSYGEDWAMCGDTLRQRLAMQKILGRREVWNH